MFNMFDIMGKVKDAQAKIKKCKEDSVHITFVGESGAGMVKVKVNGFKQVLSIDIDNDLVKPEDKQILTDLIIAATNKAIAGVDELTKAELKKATEGVLPNIPGLDLFNGIL